MPHRAKKAILYVHDGIVAASPKAVKLGRHVELRFAPRSNRFRFKRLCANDLELIPRESGAGAKGRRP
ncbi:hypothetical protein LJR235_003457 [Pararhizobium sp. LjRoot235]|uniref:hypothetical protein n=1 Tax=Pararhizobium sp. LjRoot235 TaxID=3342291 RepID=UPI003ECE4CE5